MSQKRNMEDGKVRSEGSSSRPPQDKRRRFTSFRSVIWEVMKMQSFQNLLEPALEPLIRKVVKEEVEFALKKHLNSMKQNRGKEAHPSESRSLKLQFLNTLSLPVFTGTRIEGDECSTIKVALVDAVTGQVVDSGPESSAKVEIVVLEGDFDGDEEENWTVEEFKNNIVREREGKKPLLMGDAFLNFKEGVGSVSEISFTDNSSWTRSRKFRLGARVIDCFDGIRVREAKTESFVVRDHRGELYKKHHPPSLADEVWRLEKIGKDGAFHKRLSKEKIYTVKDFLTLLIIDPPRLRHILGTGMSAKMWEVTVDHARTCVLDQRVYLYRLLDSQPKAGVVFNVVGQLMGLLSEFEYLHVDNLSETEQADALNLVISAFKHWGDVMSFDDEASLMGGTSCLPNVTCSSSLPGRESCSGTKFLSSHNTDRFGYESASTPDLVSSIYSIGCENVLDDYPLHCIGSMDLEYDHPTLSFEGQVVNSLICDTDSMTQAFCDDDNLQFLEPALPSPNPCLESQADLQSALSGFLLSRSRSAAIANAHMRWTKLFSVLRWISVRNLVVLRRRNRIQELPRYSLEAQEIITSDSKMSY